MNEVTLTALTALAAKLSTTVDHLWGVLLAQAAISSYTLISIFSGLYLILAVWAYALFKGYQKKPDTEDKYHDTRYWEDETLGWNLVGIIFSAAIVTIIFLCNIPSILSGLINPEYWALMELAKIL